MTALIVWLKGIAAAAIGGAANSITVLIVDPQNFNFNEGLPKLLSVAGVGAILAVAAYLAKSPICNSALEEPKE